MVQPSEMFDIWQLEGQNERCNTVYVYMYACMYIQTNIHMHTYVLLLDSLKVAKF